MLALVCVVLAALTQTQPAAAKNCTRYRPAGCLFATQSDANIDYPAPLHPISFDLRNEVLSPMTRNERLTIRRMHPKDAGSSPAVSAEAKGLSFIGTRTAP